MDVSLREARPADLPVLRILRSQAIEAAFSDQYDRNQYAHLVVGQDDRLPTALEASDRTVTLAETTITPVSFAVADTQTGALSGIFTSPDYQRAGFGTRMLSAVEETVRSAGQRELRAVVPTVSRPFFEVNGFTQTGTGQWRGLESVRMRKRIDE